MELTLVTVFQWSFSYAKKTILLVDLSLSYAKLGGFD